MSDVASWQWVLKDLAKRLDESVEALKHESKALHVIIKRIDEKIHNCTSISAKPGVLNPLTDNVEEAIMQVHNTIDHV